MKCNYCNSSEYKILFPSGTAQINQIVTCNHCGLMYANPRVKEPDYIDIAQSDPDFDPLKPNDIRVIKEQLQVQDYNQTRLLLNNFYLQRGKLLEIGSGLGYLLNAFQQDGWDVLGIEPWYQCCRHAREDFQLNIINGTLETANLEKDIFDVILLNHVIEHLPDPLETLKEIWRILKPGGHLVIETPRYDTFMFWLLRKRERSLRCSGHIYFFTTESLRKLYKAADFKLVELKYVGRTLTIERLIYNLIIVFNKRFKLPQRILQRKIYLNLRDMQRVVLTKETK